MQIDRKVVNEAIDALEDACGGRCNAEYNPCWQWEVAQTLKAALLTEPCLYPDCVDNGPEGKCTRWLLAECSKSSDFNPHRSAEPVRGPVAGPAKNVHDKVYSEVELADAYQKGWNHAMLRRSLGPHGIKEGA
jgi:hypothetical protein